MTSENVKLTIQNQVRDELISRLKLGHKRLLWSGIAFFLLVVTALFFPGFTSLSIDLIIGWILFFVGLTTFYYAFSYEGTGPFFGALLSSLLTLGLGIVMVFRPGIGLLALTLVIAGLFIVDGAFKLFLAIEIRRMRGWIWVLISAIASIVLGFLIAAEIPSSALYTIGILVGLNFVITGISLLALAQSAKKTVSSV